MHWQRRHKYYMISKLFWDDRDDYYTTIEKMLSRSQTDKLYNVHTYIFGTDYTDRQITKICFEPIAVGRDE